MNTTGKLLEIATDLQKNSQDEAGAITGYTELLKKYKEAIDSTDSQSLKEIYKEQMEQVIEFISDEQNHLKTLQEMYQKLTNIEPAKD